MGPHDSFCPMKCEQSFVSPRQKSLRSTVKSAIYPCPSLVTRAPLVGLETTARMTWALPYLDHKGHSVSKKSTLMPHDCSTAWAILKETGVWQGEIQDGPLLKVSTAQWLENPATNHNNPCVSSEDLTQPWGFSLHTSNHSPVRAT